MTRDRFDGNLDFNTPGRVDADVVLFAKLYLLQERNKIQGKMRGLVDEGDAYMLSTYRQELRTLDDNISGLNGVLSGTGSSSLSIGEIQKLGKLGYDQFMVTNATTIDFDELEEEVTNLEENYDENAYLTDTSGIEEELEMDRLRNLQIEENEDEGFTYLRD